jgi:hypothetical protein
MNHKVHFVKLKDIDKYEDWSSRIFSMYETFFENFESTRSFINKIKASIDLIQQLGKK